ncbi:Putative LOC100892748, partial [Caligus rogercresseyi]
MKQAVGEPIDDFLTRLRGQAKFCRFTCTSCQAPYEDDVVLGTIIKNTSNRQLRRSAFERKAIKLNEVVQLGRALESVEAHSREMVAEHTAMASEYKGLKGSWRAKKNAPQKFHVRKPPPSSPLKKLCKFCATPHILKRRFCPAVGKVCSKCSLMDHFAVCCKTGASNAVTCDTPLSYRKTPLSYRDTLLSSYRTTPLSS